MSSIFRNLRTHAWTAICGTMLLAPATAATTPGVVTLTGTINDYTGGNNNSTSHFSVAWVTDSSGAFIKTLWRQGPGFTSKEWRDHTPTYENTRAGSTAIDGFTGATSTTYVGVPNNPVTTTWNCRDANGNMVPDGDYNFYIQYAESQTVNNVIIEGPLTTALTWTKGPAASTINPPAQGAQGSPANGNNFTNLSIVWSPATEAPAITSAAPPVYGSMGTAYSHTLVATGSPQILFGVSSGSLPTGLSLTPAGVLSGTPTVAGTFFGTISADNGMTLASQPFSITIAEAIVFTNTVLTNGNRTKEYYHACTVIGSDTVTYSLDSGTLPPGVTLASNGVISGTPTTLGTFTGKIKAENGLAPATLQDFSIVISPASEGYVSFVATISDYTWSTQTTKPTEHYTAVWVTDAAGKFIKTLWKQGAGFTNKDWNDHLPTYNNARAGSTVVDGFTSATAMDYASPNNPIMVNWNCRDADGNLVDDGNYKFWIQYSENQSRVPGPVTSGLTWTKGATSTTVYPPAEGTQGTAPEVNNFSAMAIVWTPAPDIVVHDSGHGELLDGDSMDLGSQEIDTTGMAHTFTIKNEGSADLTIPAVAVYGTDSSDFAVTAPTANKLAPAASATFTVTFKPGVVGTRSATLQIASNDPDESTFEIALSGTGTPPPAPEIDVQQPSGSSLVDGSAKKSFGTVKIGKSSSAKTFKIKNTGTAPLTGLKVLKNKGSKNEFVVGDLSATSLDPGKSATFKVTFKPQSKGSRSESLYIKSNDTDECPFSIKLTGEAVK